MYCWLKPEISANALAYIPTMPLQQTKKASDARRVSKLWSRSMTAQSLALNVDLVGRRQCGCKLSARRTGTKSVDRKQFIPLKRG